ncbi:MAG: hypothetical protein LBU79_04480 [Planctomycetota bacterium]|jgi:hypothetical protein|nr:hypothetical protein [Planctomycetota bacterium]
MNNLFSWLSLGVGMLLVGFLWFAYLVKIVFNDEVVQERRRRRMRARELERRATEDKANKAIKKPRPT